MNWIKVEFADAARWIELGESGGATFVEMRFFTNRRGNGFKNRSFLTVGSRRTKRRNELGDPSLERIQRVSWRLFRDVLLGLHAFFTQKFVRFAVIFQLESSDRPIGVMRRARHVSYRSGYRTDGNHKPSSGAEPCRKKTWVAEYGVHACRRRSTAPSGSWAYSHCSGHRRSAVP